MRPIRLAVIFDQRISAGGGYQQALNAALVTTELNDEAFTIVYYTTVEDNVSTLASYGIQAELIRYSRVQTAFNRLRSVVNGMLSFKPLKSCKYSSPFENYLTQRQIDLVYFLAPSSLARDLKKINYVITVWDLCHRDDPEFPEVRWNDQFEAREKYYRALLPRAVAVFVDSDFSKRNIVRWYGIDDERVFVMPFQAAAATRRSSHRDPKSLIAMNEKYNLHVPYVFYPAQFWAHKNHIYLIEGLRILEDRYQLRIGAIFSGGDQGNINHVKSFVRRLNLEDRVRFVGFVDNEEIPELYRQSVALVMPSYFGPTNLPPLEAFELGVPVLYPSKSGLRDQVADAALLMDLSDPGSMADHLKNLVEDPGMRQRLQQAGTERLKDLDSIDRLKTLRRVLEGFRRRRLTWP